MKYKNKKISMSTIAKEYLKAIGGGDSSSQRTESAFGKAIKKSEIAQNAISLEFPLDSNIVITLEKYET